MNLNSVSVLCCSSVAALSAWTAACSPKLAEPIREPAVAPAGSAASSDLSASSNALRLLPVGAAGVRVRSEFSDIVVRAAGSVRSLFFVDDEGKEHLESRLDVEHPERLMVPYTRSMFASYLFMPVPKRVLVIGVGAGSMLRFLEHHDPEVRVEGVDIDPVVLEVARDYFGTASRGNTEVFAADGFDYIEKTPHLYDVIYLDAFLKPAAEDAQRASGETDVSGVPRRLKTIDTYRRMQSRLTDGGVVVVNLHYATLEHDVATLSRAFSAAYLFDVPRTGNHILVGTGSKAVVDTGLLRERGRQVDERLRAPFLLSDVALRWRRVTSTAQ